VFDPQKKEVTYFQRVDGGETTQSQTGFEFEESKVVFDPPIQVVIPAHNYHSGYGYGTTSQLQSVQMKPRHVGLCLFDEKGDRWDQYTRKEKDELFQERW